MAPHLPILRAGRPYRSLTTAELRDVRDGSPVAEVSQSNRGLIARDFARAGDNRRALEALSVAEIVTICRRAGELFRSAELPLGEDLQGPELYLEQLAATTGMPIALGRRNLEKICGVLEGMPTILDGLSRGLDLSLLDDGWGEVGGRRLAYQRQADQLGAILPNNSPGVHGLWIPALPLKVPLVLKPGSREPWTPWRIAQALIAAGCPPEGISLYPTDPGSGIEILLRADRSLLFGDEKTVARWRRDHRIQIHGPGWSKVLLDEAAAERYPDLLDLLEHSVATNGGRSCLNASGVWTPANGRAIAEALAERLAAIPARPLDHPEAALAAFSDPRVASAIDHWLDGQLTIPGAVDLTEPLRGPRRVEVGGCTFLLPTVVWCEDPTHPLRQAELLFPFVSVVEVPRSRILAEIGPTLVATAVTDDEAWAAELHRSPSIDRLNLGEISTMSISWDQPHEGNLFEHLWRQRSLQMVSA